MSVLVRLIQAIFLITLPLLPLAQDTLKVHFLYGSKPRRQYRDVEPKWFGGILGGHVGIEADSNKIVNFGPSGKFHLFQHPRNKHSSFHIHSIPDFYAIMGGIPDSMKKTIVCIPITPQQKQKFDSIATAYLQTTPYDYALFGMRCSAAAYDILGQLGILPVHSRSVTYKKIFYPKLLRKPLLKIAAERGWKVLRYEGTSRRKWEKD